MNQHVDVETRSHRSTAMESSVPDLLKELRDEGTTLFRQELMLAKQEMSEKMGRVGRNLGYLAAGGLAAYAGVVVVLLALSALLYMGLVELGLSNMVSGWLAPLIVGAVVAIIGFAMMKKAQHTLSEETAVPERTRQSLQEDKDWLQQKVTQ